MRRILLVEDDKDLAELMRELLGDVGAQTYVAHSLGEAKAQYTDVLACDLAIVDINLGEGQPSGVDVHAWLRAESFGGEIVFLTGHARSHPLVVAAAATPSTRILAKPIDAATLLSCIGAVS